MRARFAPYTQPTFPAPITVICISPPTELFLLAAVRDAPVPFGGQPHRLESILQVFFHRFPGSFYVVQTDLFQNAGMVVERPLYRLWIDLVGSQPDFNHYIVDCVR